MKITVQATVAADAAKAWRVWNDAKHITKWNAANDDWHCPTAKVDLRVGGQMTSRMEAKDGSMGFDFAATYTKIEPQRLVEFRLDDGRMVKVEFVAKGKETLVKETFDAEAENDPEFQRAGWQAILDRYATYTASL